MSHPALPADLDGSCIPLPQHWLYPSTPGEGCTGTTASPLPGGKLDAPLVTRLCRGWAQAVSPPVQELLPGGSAAFPPSQVAEIKKKREVTCPR